jgi:hypothetical protein
VKSLLVGRVLVSVPYATYGGILADSHEVAAALLASAQELCRTLGARYLELRHREPNDLGLPKVDRYDTFRKALPEQVEGVMASLPRKTRAAARNGLKRLGEGVAWGGSTSTAPDATTAGRTTSSGTTASSRRRCITSFT